MPLRGTRFAHVAIMVAAATVLAVTSACDRAGLPGAPDPVTSPAAASAAPFEAEVLALVNERRAAGATCGDTAYPPASPLSMHAQLLQAARAHSQDMAAQDYFSHTSADGRTVSQRIRAAGYTASPIGENIAAGYTSPQTVVTGWMDSPGHCRNIMSADFRAIGVGYAFAAASSYRHYWTQNFGGG